MYLFLVLLSAIALSAGFWLDNPILHPVLRWWWVFLVAAFIVVSLQSPLRSQPPAHRNLIVLCCAGSMMAFILFTSSTMLIYLAGTILLLAWIVATRLNRTVANVAQGSPWLLIVLIAIALGLLPIAINRVQVRLPNLSAGTLLTLYQSSDDSPLLDAQFYNRINDHQEIVASLGTEILFQQPHDAPLLQIQILRPKIVVRLVSIEYETRLAYYRLPLFRLTGERLLQLQVAEQSAPFNMQMDHGRLLIDQLSTSHPAMIQLPHMDDHSIPYSSRAVVVGARILLWLMICFGLMKWARSGLVLRGHRNVV